MTTKRTATPKPAPPKPQDAHTEPNIAEGGPVDCTPGPDREGEELFVTAKDGVPLNLVQGLENPNMPSPWDFDTFVILNDSGQNFLDGPVPVRPVLFTGPLVSWLSTGACPWGDMDVEHLVLRLANITMEFTVGETLDDSSVVLTPGAHLWAEAAAWTLSSDGTETAVPRG